jgi:hypothetical protein
MATTGRSPQDYPLPPATGWGLYYDPLYGYVPLPPVMRRALDLPSMQRLRHLRQLSTVELVFSGATHTRFEHSVGVYHLATAVFETLWRRFVQESRSVPALAPEHKMALQFAALFHDLGHGPYSHVFEIFCERNPDFATVKHEQLTKKLIIDGMGPYHDVPRFLRAVHAQLIQQNRPPEYADFVLPENVAAIASGEPPPRDPKYLFLSQVISSEYDVDRMDYLRRDALHTGVGTGGVDIWEIVHSYVVPEEPSEHGIWEAKISCRAAEAIEALLAARDLAYRRVYYHRTHRGAQEMMIRALYDLVSEKRLSKEELALYTDTQLLDAFASDIGTPLTRDVATRVRYRRAYEPLPFEVQVHRDLDEEARAGLSSVVKPKTTKEYRDVVAAVDQLSSDVGFPSEQRIIFDIQPIPISRKQAYTRPYFYEETHGTTHSLLELLPHLGLTHGSLVFAGETVDLYERYWQEVCKLLVFVPFDVFADYVARVGAQALVHTEEELEKLADECYETKMKPVFEHLVRFLGLRDQQKRMNLEDRFSDSIRQYLLFLTS